ncbi:hypothetical protein C8F01DRAFT_984631 [Mycena amicta]|nr:hypothetical protein C8F01DRAFT_984631 [Mycena amicta]
MNPIRTVLNNVCLLRKAIPIERLTSGRGLSSLLAFMGTGQGTMTEVFLNNNSFDFVNKDACITVFTNAEAAQSITGLPAPKYKNTGIYGQQSTSYSAHPTLRIKGVKHTFTLQEKFEPFFNPQLQHSYEAFLGTMANQDPRTYDGPRRSWAELLGWLHDQRLHGFGIGLGTLQFANNLALAGVVIEPSLEEMGQWISNNRSLGAFEGLQVLGFRNLDSDAAVRAAFICADSWFSHYLTAADKEILGDGAMSTEQRLCKTSRWKNRAWGKARMRLGNKARAEFNKQTWSSGVNITDHTKFPIPCARDMQPTVFKSIIEDG